MATITEDYCSRETYRLLIKKGFDVEVHTTFDKEGYTQPSITLQMAMKWLREAHNIFIDIRFNRTYQRYKYFVFFMGTNDDDMYDHTNLSKKESYEETVESALRYCLENLI